MRAKDANLQNGAWVDRTYWGGVFTRWDGAVFRDTVSPGPIIAGNRRDPNGWWYQTLTNRWSQTRIDSDYPSWFGGPESGSGYLPGANGAATPLWSDYRDIVYNQALERLNAKVRGDLDLAVSLAEFGQTRRMLANLARMREFGKGLFRGIGDRGDAANGWLGLQYGWKPLMGDLFGIVNEMFEVTFACLRNISASAKIPLTGLGKLSNHHVIVVPWDAISEGSGKVSCRIKITLRLNDNYRLDRLASLNPVSLAWELLPYSFIVDWLYDIGGYLRAAETALLYGANFEKGYVSELYAYDGVEYTKHGQEKLTSSWPPITSRITQPLEINVSRREFQRTRLSSYPFPRAPSFRCNMGSENVLTTAFLLSQMIKKNL